MKKKKWIEINDDSYEMYNTNSETKFKTSMLRSSLCDYSNAYIVVKGTITVTVKPPDATEQNKWTDERDKGVIFKNCGPFTDCINKTNNLDAVILMYNLIEYSNNYLKASDFFGSITQMCQVRQIMVL